jgi:hypothetical protein
MPQSLSSILIHLIFSTKNREPFITAAIETELHPYMAKIFREYPKFLKAYGIEYDERYVWD